MFNETAESFPIVHQIGWMIIHSLWQATFIGFLLALGLKVLQNSSSDIRYVLSCAALALMLFCPPATAYFFNANSPVRTEVQKIDLSEGKSIGSDQKRDENKFIEPETEEIFVSQKSESAESFDFAKRAESFFPLMITLWLIGVMIFSLRLSIGFLHTRQLIKYAADSSDSALHTILDDLTERLKIKRAVRILESFSVKVPMTVGWLYPVILFPPSTLTGLTPQQLHSIIAHELAHIKRYDFLINLLQAGAEILLFYHPAARWASNKIRKEREFACDDLTLKLCGNPFVYARALTTVARLGNQSVSLAATATGGDLTNRIRRLVINQPYRTDSRLSTLYGVLLIVSLFFAVSAGFAISFQADKKSWGDKTFSSNENEIIRVIHKAEENSDPTEINRLKIYDDELSKEDLRFRQIAVESLKGHHGSVVIMNPQTGQVYTIVNQNRAFRRGLSPASTFKIVTVVAALEENKLRNSEKGIGYDTTTRLNLTRALAISNNNYFKSLGKATGSESLIKYAKLFGFGNQTGINYDGEIGGFVPDAVTVENVWFGAAGGEVEVTPLQLAIFTSAIVNGGKILVPQAAKDNQTVVPQERAQLLINENTLAELKKGLRETVINGTGNAADIPGNMIAGKTGTIKGKNSGIGLFTSYAPADNPSVVVVVTLDGKNETGAIAAEVAGKIYQKLSNDSVN